MNPPPILVSFYNDLDKYFEVLPPPYLAKYGIVLKYLYEQNLPPVVSITNLAALFGYSKRFVGLMSKRQHDFYRSFCIPKGRNGKRVIQAPKVALKVIQKWFGYHLAENLKFPDHVCGFVPNRSHIHGANVHIGANWIYSTDIKDFFQSTSENKIESVFLSLGYPERGAKLSAALCCYNGFLAQGAPSSPVLSNLTFRMADEQIYAYCSRLGLKYSRYADDIAISGSDRPPKDIESAIRGIIELHGYQVSDNKESLRIHPQRLKVYGLLVHGKEPRLSKGYRNRLRAIKHLLKYDRIRHDELERAHGHISYENSIDIQNKRLRNR